MAQPPSPAPNPGLNPLRRWLADIKATFVLASDLYQLTKRVDRLEADLTKTRDDTATSFRKTGEDFRTLGERVAKLEGAFAEALKHMDTKVELAVMKAMKEVRKDEQ
jgi:hypothetical protein